jgi:pimeloyl-ACP methyl ester carboxylesterase
VSTPAAATTGTPVPDSLTPPAREAGGGRGHRLARVVAAAVAVGLFGAAALALVVVPGAPEHVVTGGTLLAFALGWATLALGSARLTDRSQRWAWVPAAAMAATGAGLVLLAPGDGALTAAGWVWPPALLVLVAWTAARARRSLRTRARSRLVWPVLGGLLLAAVGGGLETVRLSSADAAPPMPGQVFDVGGHRLHLACTGTGSPTVVLEGGLGETSPMWGHVQPAVSGTTRVCAYDRPGQAWSGDAPGPQDGRQVAADLRTLLDRAGERGPYLLVGHSTGGTHALVFAAAYPADVAGMVLLDSASPDQFTVLPDFPAAHALLRRATALLPPLGRLGAGRLLNSSVGSTLPPPAAAAARAFATTARDMRQQRDDVSVYPTLFRQAQELTSLGDRPLVVVTATAGQPQPGWSTAQDRLAVLSTDSDHRLTPATHASLLADRHDAAASVAAVEDVVHAVRTGSPVRTG